MQNTNSPSLETNVCESNEAKCKVQLLKGAEEEAENNKQVEQREIRGRNGSYLFDFWLFVTQQFFWLCYKNIQDKKNR